MINFRKGDYRKDSLLTVKKLSATPHTSYFIGLISIYNNLRTCSTDSV